MALFVGAACGFFFLRLYPIWPRRHEGCDAYNILLCAETLREGRRLPIRLPPLFILEEEVQWYPPSFLVFCALLPPEWLKRNYWLLNHIIDFIHIGLGFWLLALAGQPTLGIVAAVVYAAMAGLVQEYSALNTRPLGVLAASGFLLLAYAGMESSWALAGAALVGVLLLYTHKLATQFVWFAIPVIAALTGDLRWLAWLPAVYAMAFLVWPRGFLNIVAGHRAIVRFWGRYWPLLGAHMVRQSGVYGDGETRQNFYGTDERSNAIAFVKDAFHQNYFVVATLVLVVVAPSLTEWERMLTGWILSAYVAALVIHFIRPLRAIGLGRQYIKFGILPTLVLVGQRLAETGSVAEWMLAVVAVLLTARQYWLIIGSARNGGVAQTGRITPDLQTAIETLKGIAGVRLMCLPVHLCDLVAYLARVPVYWGTHSHVFDERLAAFFPVLRYPIEQYAVAEGLTHLLLDRNYVSSEELKLDPCALVMRQGQFELFTLQASRVKVKPSDVRDLGAESS